MQSVAPSDRNDGRDAVQWEWKDGKDDVVLRCTRRGLEGMDHGTNVEFGPLQHVEQSAHDDVNSNDTSSIIDG